MAKTNENLEITAKFNKDAIGARMKLGDDAFNENRFEEAIGYYTEALEAFERTKIKPEYSDFEDYSKSLYKKRGEAYEKIGNQEKANSDFQKAGIKK